MTMTIRLCWVWPLERLDGNDWWKLFKTLKGKVKCQLVDKTHDKVLRKQVRKLHITILPVKLPSSNHDNT